MQDLNLVNTAEWLADNIDRYSRSEAVTIISGNIRRLITEEREACAKVADQFHQLEQETFGPYQKTGWAHRVAAAIRERN